MPSRKLSARPQSPRIAKKRERSRREILEASERVLRNRGFDAVTLGSVAGELGLTKQALYHYFPSKEALVKSLVVELLDAEIEALVAAVDGETSDERVLGTLIRAFYRHYEGHLDAFRAIYCAAQLYPTATGVLDEDVLRNEINPRTRRLFDVMEERLSTASMNDDARAERRRLAFTAWLAALGLVNMLGLADAVGDPLRHGQGALVDTLATLFDGAAS